MTSVSPFDGWSTSVSSFDGGLTSAPSFDGGLTSAPSFDGWSTMLSSTLKYTFPMIEVPSENLNDTS